MIKASDIKLAPPLKINIERLLKEIECDALNGKLVPDGHHYDLSYDPKGVEEVKKILDKHGFEGISDLTGYRDGWHQISLWVHVKRDVTA